LPTRLHPYAGLQRRCRAARMRKFIADYGVTPSTRILDVGGDGYNWALVDVRPRLVILNTEPPDGPLPENATFVRGDGCSLPFADRAFDIVFSNSVIEHLATRDRQKTFAREIRRVGHRYYVQTPNRWFPIEPHLITPFVHYLPHRWQRALYPYTLWGLIYHPTPAEMDANFQQIRLLTLREFGSLFPEASMDIERVAMLAKSFIAQCLAPVSMG
jgi:SAM-dependent methyltransferase